MVNMQPGEQGEQQWYPKLPEGYVGNPTQNMSGYASDSWSPDMGMPGHDMQGMAGYNMQAFSPGQEMSGYDMQAFSPEQGMSEYGMQAFSPEQEMAGYDMQAFSPEQDMAGYDMQAFSPGQEMSGHDMQGFSQGQEMSGHVMQGFQPGQRMPGRGMPPGGGFPGQGPPGFPGQRPGQRGPSGPPPTTTPAYPSTQLFAVDPGAIRGCLYRYTFIWLSRRQGFWFFPVFVGRTSVAGYRWRSRQRRWEYMGIDLNRIDRFSCF